MCLGLDGLIRVLRVRAAALAVEGSVCALCVCGRMLTNAGQHFLVYPTALQPPDESGDLETCWDVQWIKNKEMHCNAYNVLLVPYVPQVSDAPSHPCDVKENVIHQTRPPSSIASWTSSDAHVPIVVAFGGGQGSAGTPWLFCGYVAPTCNKLRCTVYSDTFLSEPALTFSAIGATAACLSVGPHGPIFAPHMHQWALAIHDPSPVHHCSYLGPLFIDTDHCTTGTPNKSCSFGAALTQSSHQTLTLVIFAQILTLAHSSCF